MRLVLGGLGPAGRHRARGRRAFRRASCVDGPRPCRPPRFPMRAGKLSRPGTSGPPRGPSVIWPLMLLLWTALNAVFLSRDLFNLYVGNRASQPRRHRRSSPSAGKPEALAAAMRYMLFATCAARCSTSRAWCWSYAALVVLDIDLLAARDPCRDRLSSRLALMTGGANGQDRSSSRSTSGCPPAHGAATTAPASANSVGSRSRRPFLRDPPAAHGSRRCPTARETGASFSWRSCGTAAMVWVSLRAFVETRLKLIVAIFEPSRRSATCFSVFPLAGGAAKTNNALRTATGRLGTGAKKNHYLRRPNTRGETRASPRRPCSSSVGLLMNAASANRWRTCAGARDSHAMTAFAFALAAGDPRRPGPRRPGSLASIS